jgi:hypothetical protein
MKSESDWHRSSHMIALTLQIYRKALELGELQIGGGSLFCAGARRQVWIAFNGVQPVPLILSATLMNEIDTLTGTARSRKRLEKQLI